MLNGILHYRKALLFGLLALLLWQACQEARTHDLDRGTEKPERAIVDRDLDSLLADKRLIVMTKNSSTSYYIYKGEPMGFEYDILKEFADHHELELEVSIVDDMRPGKNYIFIKGMI